MKKLVFICRGNMFRSPIAKAIFNHNPKPGWQAYSYGTAVEAEGRQGISLKEWGPGIQFTIAKMKTLGMNIAHEYCDQILPEHAKSADKIIMMSERDYIPVWLNAYTWDYWEVPNPDICTEAIINEVIALLTKNIEALKKVYNYRLTIHIYCKTIYTMLLLSY